MTTLTEYDAPAVWAPRLISWANDQAEAHEQAVRGFLHMNMIADAESAQAQIKRFRVGIDRLRVRLVDISGLTEADVMDAPATVEPQAVGLADACKVEPPVQLVGFVGWCRLMTSKSRSGSSATAGRS